MKSSEKEPLPQWQVRPVAIGDYQEWRRLFAAYARFYGIAQNQEQADLVWTWLLDPEHEEEGLLVVSEKDEIVGLGHFRAFARPSTATVGGYLDDLFVDPDQRGTGAADALIARLRAIAVERDWSVVRWITADNNYRARAKYDQFATRTSWITYDMPVADPLP